MTKTIGIVVLLGMMSWFGASAASAQSAKEIAVQSSSDMRLLITFGRMERGIADIDHIVTHSIVASVGGWDIIADRDNADLILDKANEVQGVAERSNSTIQNNKAATEFQKSRSAETMELVDAMLSATRQIAAALANEDVTSASEIYETEYRRTYTDAMRVARTSTVELEKSLSGTLFRLSVAQ